MLNDEFMTRFVAILTRFTEGPIRSIRRDARVSAGFREGKGTNTEHAKILWSAAGPYQPVVVGSSHGWSDRPI